ncbi:hypothetical protein HRbin41_01081 [bacterium HR41]|nr:hypothetical protein HRbin41_01081 [bacterium HR41]
MDENVELPRQAARPLNRERRLDAREVAWQKARQVRRDGYEKTEHEAHAGDSSGEAQDPLRPCERRVEEPPGHIARERSKPRRSRSRARAAGRGRVAAGTVALGLATRDERSGKGRDSDGERRHRADDQECSEGAHHRQRREQQHEKAGDGRRRCGDERRRDALCNKRGSLVETLYLRFLDQPGTDLHRVVDR